jgi:hypothetical protein
MTPRTMNKQNPKYSTLADLSHATSHSRWRRRQPHRTRSPMQPIDLVYNPQQWRLHLIVRERYIGSV